MDDANAAFLGQGNRQGRLGHCIHRRRNQGDIDSDITGQHCAGIGLRGNKVTAGRDQQHIVKSDAFTDNFSIIH